MQAVWSGGAGGLLGLKVLTAERPAPSRCPRLYSPGAASSPAQGLLQRVSRGTCWNLAASVECASPPQGGLIFSSRTFPEDVLFLGAHVPWGLRAGPHLPWQPGCRAT